MQARHGSSLLFWRVLFPAGAALFLAGMAFRSEPLRPWATPPHLLLAAGAILLLIWAEMLLGKRFPALRPYLYLQPTFLLLIVFCYIPPIQALLRAFYRWKQSGVAEYIGLDHFRYMLHDTDLHQSFINLAQLGILQVILTVSVPLGVAELIFAVRSSKARYWYRLLLIVPMIVPVVVIFLIWEYLLNYDVGLFNRVLLKLGMDPLGWFKDPRMALYCFVLMGFPWVSGVSVLIYLAGLDNIGEGVLESCQIEGARFRQRFLHIDLPLLRGQIKLLSVLSVIGTLNGWVAQWVITKGGPGNATLMPALHMFLQGMRFDYMGYACAIGLVLFLLVVGLTYLNMKLLRSERD